MSRLCSNSSRSYPGRPARRAALYKKGCVLHGNMRDDWAGVSRSHSRCRKFLVANGNEPRKARMDSPHRRAEHVAGKVTQ